MAIDVTEANLYKKGAGDAFVWGENKALRGLQSQMQQEKLRREKEDVELSEQIGKINYDTAREQDLPEILNQYGKIKDTFTKIRGTQNQMERIKLQSELNQQKSDLSRAVNLSKQAGVQLGEFGKLALKNSNDLSDEFPSRYKTLNGLSVFDPRFKEETEYLTANALRPKFDQLGVNKKLIEASTENINPSKTKVEDLGGGKKSYYTEKGTTLNREALEGNVLQLVGSDKGMQYNLKKMYPNLTTEQAVKAYADDLYNNNKSKNKVERVGVSATNPYTDPYELHKKNRLFDVENPTAPTLIGIPQSMNIPFNKGKATVTVDQYIPMTLGKKNFAGSEYIDLKTGKAGGKLPSSSDYEIVGIGNAPIMINRADNSLNGALAQPSYVEKQKEGAGYIRKPMIHVQVPATANTVQKDLLIPYDRLPENVKNSKQVREALVNFKPAKTEVSVKYSDKTTTKGKYD